MKNVVFLSVIGFANVPNILNRYINEFSTKYRSTTISVLKHGKYEMCADYIMAHMSKLAARQTLMPIFQSADVFIFCNEIGYVCSDYIKNWFPDLCDLVKDSTLIFYQTNQPKTKYSPLLSRYDLCIFTPDAHSYYDGDAKVFIPGCPVNVPDDIDVLLNNRRNSGKIVVSHVPSRPEHKGTDVINEVMKRIVSKYDNIEWIYRTGLSYEEGMNIKRMSDIYIDQYTDGGGFGTSSIEALQFGCITLATMHNVTDYESYPITNIEYKDGALYTLLDKLCGMDKEDLVDEMERVLRVVRERYTAEPYMKYFEQEILDAPKTSINRTGFIDQSLSLLI